MVERIDASRLASAHALQGDLIDADGNVLVNFFDQFKLPRPTVPIDVRHIGLTVDVANDRIEFNFDSPGGWLPGRPGLLRTLIRRQRANRYVRVSLRRKGRRR